MTDKLMERKKREVVERYLNGESVYSTCSKLQMLYSRIKKYRAESNNKSLKAVNLKNFCILENKVKCLEDVIEILKIEDYTVSAHLRNKLNALEHGSRFPLRWDIAFKMLINYMIGP